MIKVLRTKPGELVRLFDGAGHEGNFVVLEVGKPGVILEAAKLTTHEARGNGLWLALGWNKSSRRGYLLEKAVELQAAGILFWQAEFSQGRLPAEAKEKWREKSVQAAKQCGEVWLPELGVIHGGVQGVVEYAVNFERTVLAWEKEDGVLLSPRDLENGKTLVVIGPEGGLAVHEAQSFMDGGFAAVSLGKSILRWETAALHCLSLSLYAREAAQQ